MPDFFVMTTLNLVLIAKSKENRLIDGEQNVTGLFSRNNLGFRFNIASGSTKCNFLTT